MDPLGAHRFRQNLQKLRYLRPLLGAYQLRGDTEALRQAADLTLDWARANPLGGAGIPVEAWIDKIVGDRVPTIAFTTRAAACEGLLSRAEARDLLASLRDHGAFLTDAGNYVPDNHGLFADTGLFLLGDYLPFLRQSERWQRLALRRFKATLTGRLANGIWLEHSTAYQFFVLGALEDLAGYADDSELDELVERMREAAAWLVMPDSDVTQFGSSNLVPVPDWALQSARELEGMRVFGDAGFATVSTGGDPREAGYLAVTAGFHNLVHKHADDLSFELYDSGHRVVTDTGLYHKDPGEERDFILSASAHSVLAVDGQTFPIGAPANAYGSGLVASGEGDGWWAIVGRNPLVAAQDVNHRRLFLYRPGTALVVVDRIRAPEAHTYSRFFQLGPDLELASDRGPRAVALRADGFSGELYDAPATAPTQRSEVRGSEDPLQGWTSPDFREFLPRWTVQLDSQGSDVTHVATLGLEDSAPRAIEASWNGRRAQVRLSDGVTLELRFEGDRVAVSESESGA